MCRGGARLGGSGSGVRHAGSGVIATVTTSGYLFIAPEAAIYPKSDDAAEDHIARSHAFGVRRNDARSEQIAFLRALDRKRARPPGKGDRSRGRDHLRAVLGLNNAACPRRARGINGDDLRRAPGDRRACDQHHGRTAKKTQRSTVRSLPAPDAPSSDNQCGKARGVYPNRTPWAQSVGAARQPREWDRPVFRQRAPGLEPRRRAAIKAQPSSRQAEC